MFKKMLILIASLTVLTACQSSTDRNSSSQSKTSQSVKKRNKIVGASSSRLDNSTNRTPSQPNDSAETPNPSTSQSSTQRPIASKGLYYSVEGKDGEVIIVNKKHPLDPSYAPGENPIAKEAFLRLLSDMRAAGFVVSDNYSGFRSYEVQSGLYQGYVARDGQAIADTYSARPGFSEHQTGLAFDIMDGAGALLTEPTAAAWLAENAHNYGFIVRYPLGKEAVTGFTYESWHIRYIGSEATAIYQSGLTLEEYYGFSGGDYTQ